LNGVTSCELIQRAVISVSQRIISGISVGDGFEGAADAIRRLNGVH
jgi:hypothetical protein